MSEFVSATESPIRNRDRASWERRAITIQLKAEALLDEMVARLGADHVLPEFADGVVEQSVNLTHALRKRATSND